MNYQVIHGVLLAVILILYGHIILSVRGTVDHAQRMTRLKKESPQWNLKDETSHD